MICDTKYVLLSMSRTLGTPNLGTMSFSSLKCCLKCCCMVTGEGLHPVSELVPENQDILEALGN